MYKLVKTLEIVFENCEYSDKMSVGNSLEDDVKCLLINNVQERIARMATNAVGVWLFTNDFILSLNPKANRPVINIAGEKEEKLLFDRITEHDDITGLVLSFDDGSESEISIQWNDNDEFDNRNQRSTLSKLDGTLTVTVREPW